MSIEQPKPFVVPTLSKAKISNKLSYPIGAEQITAALAITTQLPLLKLHFYWGTGTQLELRHYEFMRVEYLKEQRLEPKWPITKLYQRPSQYQWEIVVQPVPRALRHPIHEYIKAIALPQIASWLNARSELQQRGNDILSFFYDEKKNEFVSRTQTQLEPLST